MAAVGINLQAQGMVGDAVDSLGVRIARLKARFKPGPRYTDKDIPAFKREPEQEQVARVPIFDRKNQQLGVRFVHDSSGVLHSVTKPLVVGYVSDAFADNLAENTAAAFNKAQEKAPAVKAQILTLIQRTGKAGMIAEDVLEAFPSRRYSTITARISELAKVGAIKANGTRQTKYSDSPATVWVDESVVLDEAK